ncbi:PEP-CTERM sorting domain-containing protein [Pseudoduganella albidiflava]|uniref:PEP-CTERM sorting domain-containing protein n=1 Tax=Pseudoduganella albidiflava TaxID=321983 RepID=A0A411X0V2_9BURK|nr:PEP-CTERM sorting domain-containing protein [Pseudoduganella albidiflava]QBI02495.1 PEP-CTERM sorting domain-containing protein [Pseudoduganella albidiflava]GGY42326.1 hypothetical protein GCM10007387_25380 [Pseudoduganella albidiflava]
MQVFAILSRAARLLAFAALIGTWAGTAQASVIWTLNNFNFTDGATASGTFTWEETTNRVTAWNIATTTGLFFGNSYTSDDPEGLTTVDTNFQMITFWTGNWNLRLGLASLDALDTPAAHQELFSQEPLFTGQHGYLECANCAPYRFGEAGAWLSAAVVQVPEPSALALSALALCIMVAVRRRRS